MVTKKVVAKKTVVKKPVVRKASAEKKVSADKKVISGAYVVIDFPIEAETICADHYALRIGASSHGYAEVSLNNGEWLPTRENAGYWWFDLFNLGTGKHSIAARLCDNSGTIIVKSAARKFTVK